MSWPSKAVAVASLCWVLGSSAAAQVVVLNARGPSSGAYPQGAVLPANRVISLRAGDQIEVLDAAGSHIITGPASLTAGQVDTGSKAALGDIFRRANSSRPGIAAVRGFTLQGDAPLPSSANPAPLWRLDVPAWVAAEPNDAHNFCVTRDRPPVLGRTAAEMKGRLVITDDATHASRAVSWPAGAHDLAWPSDLSDASNQVYALNLDDMGATVVRWRIISASGTLVDLARSLLDNQCYDQLDTLKIETASN